MKKMPRLDNIHAREQLLGFNRLQGRSMRQRSVKKHELTGYQNQGWTVLRQQKTSIKIQRPRDKSDLLEARVWRLLYKMEFPYLSGANGATLVFDSNDPESSTQQIDVVAIDEEIAVAIECKSYEKPKKDTLFTEKITKHQSIRGAFSRAVATAFPQDCDRKIATPIFTWDLQVRDNDIKRADEASVTLFSEDEIEYYEELVNQLGPAARFQLLADLFRGKPIPGLETSVPALRTKMGSVACYTFAVRPQYLLKISYIAHRAKGKPGDIKAYQRMVKKDRLKDIAAFISSDGMFPTNIVINFEDADQLRFYRGKQEAGADADAGGVFGWLTLTPSYGSAWIIDGQHRLFAYSGHERANTSFLHVLAFQGLTGAAQTKFFVDINSEQRRVPRKLLVELDAILKWDSNNEETRVNAIIARACMELDQQPGGPLQGRVLMSDIRRTNIRCISLTALAAALKKPGFFIDRRTAGYRQFGFLWRDGPDQALERTVLVVSSWLGTIAKNAEDWWELGVGEGGGLAMNDGVTVCIRMLQSVLRHLGPSTEISVLGDEELVSRIQPYAISVGNYFARMPPEERESFRSLRGGQGHDTGMRECQIALSNEYNDYQPDGLDEYKQRKETKTNEEARQLIDQIEKTIQERVLLMLRKQFNSNSDAWWFEGVPKNVRKKVSDRIEESGGGQREEFFDLLHYEAIIKNSWGLFRPVFAYGSRKNIGKESATSWIREIAAWRNKVAHASRRENLELDELSRLRKYGEWLRVRLAAQSAQSDAVQ